MIRVRYMVLCYTRQNQCDYIHRTACTLLLLLLYDQPENPIMKNRCVWTHDDGNCSGGGGGGDEDDDTQSRIVFLPPRKTQTPSQLFLFQL